MYHERYFIEHPDVPHCLEYRRRGFKGKRSTFKIEAFPVEAGCISPRLGMGFEYCDFMPSFSEQIARSQAADAGSDYNDFFHLM